jgi:hypothetical protein
MEKAFASWKVYVAILFGLIIVSWMLFRSIEQTHFIENKAQGNYCWVDINNNKKIDFSNVKEFTPSSLSKVTSDVEVKVFPNPASDLLFLRTNDFVEGEIEIVDVQGRKVLTQAFKGKNTEVQISSFNSGIYILKLRYKNGLVLKQSKFSTAK